VIDVSNRPDVDVRLAPVKFLFRHVRFTLPVKTFVVLVWGNSIKPRVANDPQWLPADQSVAQMAKTRKEPLSKITAGG
jgi:hypothetical protein